MDGHPHRCSTVVIQHGGLLGVHESTSPLGYVSILGQTGDPTVTLGWKEGRVQSPSDF
jgi:hypothetical protein